MGVSVSRSRVGPPRVAQFPAIQLIYIDNGEQERLRSQHLVFDLDLALLVDRCPLNAQCILHIFNAFLMLLIRALRC